MSDEMMNTKEVARYLGIHEKQVYSLIGQKRIPATRVTGKWVFPRKLIDYHLGKLGVDPAHIEGYANEAYTHLEIGLSVLSNETDVGVATIAVSQLLGLFFIPITSERFDMILDQHTFFQSGVQTLMEVLRSDSFRARVAKLGNYDFRDSGKILYAP